jgi:hypothetical protein
MNDRPHHALLASYMRHQSVIRKRPHAGFAIGGKLAGMFVENEILVDRRDREAIDFLVRRLHGEALPAWQMPEPPREMRRDRLRDVRDMPETINVRIRGEDVPLDAFERLLDRNEARDVAVSSRAGAGTAAAALLLHEAGLRGELNLAGKPTGFPSIASTEGSFAGTSDTDAYQWPEYAGKCNIAKAWMLCQALDNVRSVDHPVFIGILDCGFGFVTPTDYATSMQFNLMNNGATGVAGPTEEGDYKWHGSMTAGIATAMVDNTIGAGGVGGVLVGAARQPVAMPFLFHTAIDADEIYKCLRICVAWGIDVLNMSISISMPGFWQVFYGNWENNFQSAHDHGLIMVASAGNDAENIPEDLVILPATRTPGVITVGALNTACELAIGASNWGSAVDVWAPGENVHCIDDPDTQNVFKSGTSVASPIVAGTAALLKAANPALTPNEMKTILRDTASTDSPDWKCNRVLNAYEALLRAINFALPAAPLEEPNDQPAAARQMISTATNAWQPLTETVIANGVDVDYHRFTTTEYADIRVESNHVRPLGLVTTELIPEDPDILAFEDLKEVSTPGKKVMTLAKAPPGNWLVKLRCQAPNYYTLRVTVTPKPLKDDRFENNNARETAAEVKLRERTPLDAFTFGTHFQGAYDANIRTPTDVDWYHVTDIGERALTYPCCKIDSDAPLDITLHGPDGQSRTFPQTKHVDLRLPSPECWIEVHGTKATQYRIFFGYMLDKDKLPPPFQREDIEVIPDWWPDPPFEINRWEKWLEVTIDEAVRNHGSLAIKGDTGLTWDLLSQERSVLKSGAVEGGAAMDVRDLAPGKYLLRVGRAGPAAARFEPAQHRKLNFRVGPSF